MNARVRVVGDLLRNLKLLEARLAKYFEVLTATNGAGEGMEPGGMTDEIRSRGCARSAMRKSGNRFSARIPPYTLAIDRVHDFGWIQSKIIAI